MKIGGFNYPGLNNIGDHIQSIAAEQYLPQIDLRINRDCIRSYCGNEQLFLIMNGWFSHTPANCFPPSKQIKCLYWGFHITNWNDSWQYILKEESLQHLKQFEPIGCRDKYTTEKLKANGIDAFYSGCLTLTFPKRRINPPNGYTFLVDALHIPIPKNVLKRSISVTHSIPNYLSEESKFTYANNLLNLYRENAKLIITTRLHCALPCIAMGIPVIFFGNENDYRTSLIKDLGLKINTIPLYTKKIGNSKYICLKEKNTKTFFNSINWNPQPLNIEDKKLEMTSMIIAMIKKQLK